MKMADQAKQERETLASRREALPVEVALAEEKGATGIPAVEMEAEAPAAEKGVEEGEGSEPAETVSEESLAAEELLRCREELRQVREALGRLQAAVDRQEAENAARRERQAERAALPTFSRSFLSSGPDGGEDRYRKVMGL